MLYIYFKLFALNAFVLLVQSIYKCILVIGCEGQCWGQNVDYLLFGCYNQKMLNTGQVSYIPIGEMGLYTAFVVLRHYRVLHMT